MDRRAFINTVSLTGMALSSCTKIAKPMTGHRDKIIATWAPNKDSGLKAYEILKSTGSPLDAVEWGVRQTEADPNDQSVGIGGLPDDHGKITLDASIMDGNGHCGSVLAVEGIKHPVSLARLVMEKTPHIYLCAEGALIFAKQQGIELEELHTEASKSAYLQWLNEKKYDPMKTTRKLQNARENQHDTIGMLALSASGRMAGACSTSGLAFKMRGRIGDSPIIGSGLYVDEEVGAATATGVGEEIARVCGSYLIVERMRMGYSAQEACLEAVKRIHTFQKNNGKSDLQVCFIAMDRYGNTGSYALSKGFTYVVVEEGFSQVYESDYLLKN